jgi:hypothetical protein
MTFAGLDLHKRYITACALDAAASSSGNSAGCRPRGRPVPEAAPGEGEAQGDDGGSAETLLLYPLDVGARPEL